MSRVSRRTFVAGAAAGASLSLLPRSVTAAAFPTQTVKIVVPFSAGSMTDILARAISDKLQAKWNQTVVVENRPGVAGASSVAKGPSDGYTLMLTSNGHTVIGAVNKNLTFDPMADFIAIGKVATTPSILIAPADGPHKTLADLIATAKAKPGELSYASAGIGSSTGIAAELFKKLTGTKMVLVAHRGLPESNTSVLRGDTAMGFTFFSVGGDLIQSGRLRALAVTGDARLPQLQDVPTFKEAGLADFVYDAWFGILAQAQTPKEIVDQLGKDLADAVKLPDLKERFAPQAVSFVSETPSAFALIIQNDAERYRKLVQEASGG